MLSGPVSPRRHLLEAFASSHPELVAYARFRAENATRRRRTAGSGTDDSFGYHLYCQWAAFEQLSAAGAEIGLYADLPIGVHPDGFDPFWSPTSFLAGVHGGAPPDAFFASGQDWGFPPLHPDQIRDDGYSYVRAVLARAFRHAGYVRIDHVMGLQRLYMIPDGFDAAPRRLRLVPGRGDARSRRARSPPRRDRRGRRGPRHRARGGARANGR